VFVYDPPSSEDSPDTRAEILRRGMRAVLAIPRGLGLDDRAEALASFDGFLVGEVELAARLGTERVIPFPLSGRDGWTDAVMAQNLGATHVMVRDPVLASAIRETLKIQPWTPS
jgi:hypothetical protein